METLDKHSYFMADQKEKEKCEMWSVLKPCHVFLFVPFPPESSRSHSHSHPTVSHSAVGPMYAMSKPVTPHHQGHDGTTEKKKKKEDKDRDKHEKEKEKVSFQFLFLRVVFFSASCPLIGPFVFFSPLVDQEEDNNSVSGVL